MDNVFATDDYKSALKRIQKEDFVVLGEVMTLRYFLEQDHSCKMVLSRDRFFKSYIGIAVRKNFAHTKMFNQRFVINGNSTASHWFKTNVSSPFKCCSAIVNLNNGGLPKFYKVYSDWCLSTGCKPDMWKIGNLETELCFMHSFTFGSFLKSIKHEFIKLSKIQTDNQISTYHSQ